MFPVASSCQRNLTERYFKNMLRSSPTGNCCLRPITISAPPLTPTLKALAQRIYNDRAFDHLPLLADELEKAACDNADILSHLRGPVPHVRGCWVVDLLLGKK
jgi:hypothetical protein